MIKKFWHPSITSQYKVCPIPFHLDTYRGCTFNCQYCFARDFVTFSRRNSEHKSFAYLEGNRADLLDKWINRVLNKCYDYSKAEEVAFKERIPLKIGATADPFPVIENQEKITYDILKVLHSHDYPTEIQTKNPAGIVNIMKDFTNPNWVIAVTLITMDDNFRKVCEPNAPTCQERMEAIHTLTANGFKVMVKIQPAIYPKILKDLSDLVGAIKDSGCWAFNTEGLKIRVSMPKNEQALMQKIGDYLGINIRDYYKTKGIKNGSDWEMTRELKREYIDMADGLAKKHGIKYFVADNCIGKVGCGSECCGTQVLRNYKIWGNNERTKYFDTPDNCSKELGKCLVNFSRSTKYKNLTLNEVMTEKPNIITRLKHE